MKKLSLRFSSNYPSLCFRLSSIPFIEISFMTLPEHYGSLRRLSGEPMKAFA